MMPFDEHETKIQINAMKVLISIQNSNVDYRSSNIFVKCVENNALTKMVSKYIIIQFNSVTQIRIHINEQCGYTAKILNFSLMNSVKNSKTSL